MGQGAAGLTGRIRLTADDVIRIPEATPSGWGDERRCDVNPRPCDRHGAQGRLRLRATQASHSR